MSNISDGNVVHFHYTLKDDDGNVLDSSRERGEPMPYLHGARNIVPGLEKQLTGLSVGETLEADVPPEEGYGVHNGMAAQPVPRSEFPSEVPMQAGIQLMAQTEGGSVPIWIAKVEDETVFIDTNHPLAGKTLHFDVEITGIRDATAEEKAHGHPHGPGGHQH